MGEEEKKGEEEFWVGKHKLLVQTSIERRRSIFMILDLKSDKVVNDKVGENILWNHEKRYGLLVSDDYVVYALGSRYSGGYQRYMYSFSTRYVPDPDDDDANYLVHSGASSLDLKQLTDDDDADADADAAADGTTNTTSCRWKPLGPMINANRSSIPCASLGDKIYVFGGAGMDFDPPFGEFYDTKTCCWEPIPPPPDDSSDDFRCFIGTPVITDPKNNRLLCYYAAKRKACLYAYYPDNNNNHQWICLDPNMVWWDGTPAPVTDDDVLYFVDCNCYDDYRGMTAYDISTNKSLHVLWADSPSSSPPFDEDKLRTRKFSSMLYLGNNILCLPTKDSHSFNEDKDIALLEFYRFQVCRTSHDHVLLTPLSLHRIPVKGGLGSPINALPL